jgi:hypothetical protein
VEPGGGVSKGYGRWAEPERAQEEGERRTDGVEAVVINATDASSRRLPAHRTLEFHLFLHGVTSDRKDVSGGWGRVGGWV